MIHCDFETRSVADLTRVGIYNYATHPSTDIWCLGWAVGKGDVFVWNPTDPPSNTLLDAIQGGELIAAWNAQFERLIWNNILVKYGYPELPIERFYCTAALARARGYPGKLEKAAQFAGLRINKDMEGHRLMMKMCRPRRIEEDGTIIWWDSIEDQMRLRKYCRDDVRVERALGDNFIPFSNEELHDYHLSEKINDRGVCVDLDLAEKVVQTFDDEKAQAAKDIFEASKGAIESPSQTKRITEWVSDIWKEIPNLQKETITELLEDEDPPEHVREVLQIRSDTSRAAVSKFSAMLDRETAGKVCGMFMFRGAGQTGRFSSVGVQLHNLLRESAPELIPLFKKHGINALRMLDNPVDLLAKMVRPSFRAAPGRTFLIGDYAQIEARIVAWLAGEEKLLDVCRRGESMYCSFGERAFKHPINKSDNPKEYMAAKGCILGLGFGGSTGALARTQKAQAGIVLPEEELEYLVETYRGTYTNIKQYWHDLTNAVLMAMVSKGNIIPVGRVSYMYDGTHLWCKLPSGRLMCYPFARIVDGEYGDEVDYMRGNRYPKKGETEWPRIRLWYGILMENLAQGIAFDLLMGAIRRTIYDYYVRLHVHDEVVGEVPIDKAEEMMPGFIKAMEELPWWADGLPIEVEGQISDVYIK